MNEIKEVQQKEVEYHYRESQGFWEWWFGFKKKKGLSFFRVPLGVILLGATVLVAFSNFMDLIDYFRMEPLFTGMLFIIIFPVMIAVSFVGVILWGGFLYIPYLVFEEERKGWKELFKYIGILIGVSIGLTILYWIIFN